MTRYHDLRPNMGRKRSRFSHKTAREHVRIAEEVLGRALPSGAIVHHVDGNPANNEHSNLVICPNEAYHKLLHKRTAAFDATGNPDYRKCVFCKAWDSTDNMRKRYEGNFHHPSCAAKDSLERYYAKKGISNCI
jgi:hypothetical protein